VSKGFWKINRKSILSTFPERKKEIARLLLSDKRNRFKTEEDLIRFTVLLNE
jgi:hypothetical protein